MKKIEALHFDNLALKELPVDPIVDEKPRSRTVSGACFSRVNPTPLNNPILVSFSKSALEDLLGLEISETKRPDFAEYFCGNKIIPGTQPSAHCYCGHQFGNFAGQLGDGATMYLGEVINQNNERWEIQFKGAGRTPYSRGADGRKVLRSSIREFLCSEGNHFLGIPTTRAGTIVTSNSRIPRDIFYSGNTIMERCSVVLRIAPSFIRFGSFEIFKKSDPKTGREGPSSGLENEMLPKMLNYTIKNFYPEIWSLTDSNEISVVYLKFFEEVVRRTAKLVAEWQCVGFCHGVLNTDNMSILGVTIDYGPFGFMDGFDPDFICNGSDHNGRYSYKNQPDICQWNCYKLAEALSPVLPLSQSLSVLEATFQTEFDKHYKEKMRKKLGLLKSFDKDDDDKIIQTFLSTMQETLSDFTNSFRCLSQLKLTTLDQDEPEDVLKVFDYLMKQIASIEHRIKACKPSMPAQQLQMLLSIAKQEPSMLALFGADEEMINRDISKLKKMKHIQQIDSKEQYAIDQKLWKSWLGQYRNRLRKEIEGLSSTQIEELEKQRQTLMNQNNPVFILRNYIAQKAIEMAEKGDYSIVNTVLRLMQNPYEDSEEINQLGYNKTPPQWAADLCVT